jgi:hypothetical protein
MGSAAQLQVPTRKLQFGFSIGLFGARGNEYSRLTTTVSNGRVLVTATTGRRLDASTRSDVDRRVADAFSRLRDVDVIRDAPESAVVVAGQAFPVEAGVLETRGAGWIA